MSQRLRLADAPDVLDVAAFAALCGIGKNAAYKAIKDGLVYSVRFGRSVRIPKAAVERFLLGPNNNENGHESKNLVAVHMETSASGHHSTG